MFLICSGERRNVERARVEANVLFYGGFVSSLAMRGNEDEAGFYVGAHDGRRADEFFDWLTHERSAGRLDSCRLVELDCLLAATS